MELLVALSVALLSQCLLGAIVSTATLSKGNGCSELHECVESRICKANAREKRLQSCGSKDEQKVCCPKASRGSTQESISEKMCKKYEKEFPPIGLRTKYIQPYILGGREAQPKELPFMALIGYETGGVIDWNCGGSLISPRFILTAAHCTGRLGGPKWVKVGGLLRQNSSSDTATVYKIERPYDHPKYDNSTKYNDIALYKLETDVTFNENVRHICLSPGNPSKPYKEAATAGWGNLGLVEPRSDRLMLVNVDVFPSNVCANYTTLNDKSLPRGYEDGTMICAGSDSGIRDACQGDSGGPLFLLANDNNSFQHIQVGVTSFGKLCGIRGFPGVYSKISAFLPWIESVVWP